MTQVNKSPANPARFSFGVHFILEEKQQLDYRVNVAYTSDDEVSLYASINQAF